MSETLFTRGTADQGYGYRRGVNAFGDQGRQGGSALQRFLQNQFDESIHGMGLRAIGRAIGATYNALDQATAGSVPGLQSANVSLNFDQLRIVCMLHNLPNMHYEQHSLEGRPIPERNPYFYPDLILLELRANNLQLHHCLLRICRHHFGHHLEWLRNL